MCPIGQRDYLYRGRGCRTGVDLFRAETERVMNYTPNTTQWEKDDLVIHDADAKEAYMLMKVVGYTREGLVKTRYVNSHLWRGMGKKKRDPETYLNELKYLHDPKLWGIETA